MPVVQRNRLNSLRVKLVALILATISLPAGLFLYQSDVLQGWLVSAASDRIHKVADAWVDQESAQVAEVQRALRSLAVDPEILGTEQGECLRALHAIMAGRRGMVALHVVRRDGTVLCSTDLSALPAPAGWGFLAEIFNSRSPSISGYERLAGRKDALLFSGVPLSGRSGEALVAAIDLSWMRTAEQNAFGFPFVARLIDRSGHEIAVSPDSAAPLIGQLPAEHPIMPRLMIEAEGTADGRESDGVEKLFAFAQLPESGAKLMVAVPRIAVLGQSDRALWGGIALLALGLAAGIVAAWITVELFLLRWLDRMVEATQAIAGGRFAGNLAVADSAGELAQLGAALNEMHRQLDARQRQFRDIAQISSDWFWERDLSGRFTFFSERFEAVTGFSAADIIARSLAEREAMPIFADEAEEAVAAVRRALSEGRSFRDAVCSFKRPDGSLAWWRISGIPVFGADGVTLIGFRGTGTDVTEAKRAEAALLEAKYQAELANSAKTQFLATMSHELRTPLHAVIGFAELMESQSLGPLGNGQYLEYCRDIRESGQQLLRLVTAILDMSQIEADRVVLNEGEVDAGSLIAVAARMMRGQAASHGLQIGVEAPAAPITLIGDERRLLQSLLNLLANAVKFTAAPGLVRISAERLANGALALRVRDSGIGMSPEVLAGIGRPFWQADGTFARKHDGVGLGLALTKRLMLLHGGALEVQSAPGAGTLVTLLLPPERVEAPEIVRGAA